MVASLPGSSPGVDTARTDENIESTVRSVYRACGLDEDCIKGSLEDVVNTTPAEAVQATLALFETPAAPAPGCHWALHLLGQVLKERTRSGDDLDLSSHWHVCGYAVLHGAFEDVPLEGSVAEMGRTAFDLCLNGVLEDERIGQCFHPIGHTLEMNLPGSTTAPYLVHAEAACASGAWSARTSITPEAALKACVSGAHMRHRDGALRAAGGVDLVGEDHAQALPQCEHSLLPYACITLYMEDAFAGWRGASTGDAGRLLEWCVTKSPEAGDVCGYFFGLALGNANRSSGVGAPEMCASFETLPERVRLACLRGLFERSGQDQTSFCGRVAKLALSCEDVIELSPQYPKLERPESLLMAAGHSPDLLDLTASDGR
jgi:hypothetical protein